MKKETTNKILLSPYQKAIKQHILNKGPHLQVEAAAGSGKSTTLRLAIKWIKKANKKAKILVLQFNKHIAEEMVERLSGKSYFHGVDVKTTHSYGFGVLRENGIKGQIKSKWWQLCKDAITEGKLYISPGIMSDKKQQADAIRKAQDQLTEIVKMCYINLVDYTFPEDIKAIVDKYTLQTSSLKPEYVDAVQEIIKESISQANEGIIGFDDMIALPYYILCDFPKYDYVLIDEQQDLNKAQMELVSRSVKKDGRIMAVGDMRQAIMLFSGAMADSMTVFKDQFNATVLPLSVCYRCPSKHLDIARTVYKGIENRPDAPEGVVEYVSKEDIIAKAQVGDFVICRVTAPLIALCCSFIAKGKRAMVKGRDVSGKIIDVVEAAEECSGFTMKEFLKHVATVMEVEKKKVAGRNNAEQMSQGIEDLHMAASAAYEGYVESCKGMLSINGLKTYIKKLFSQNQKDDDEVKNYIVLCTVHRSKGLETDNVFILDYHKMPLILRNGTQEQMVQEQNIKYVALTRAKKYLGLNDPKMDSQKKGVQLTENQEYTLHTQYEGRDKITGSEPAPDLRPNDDIVF